jgi:hypothetical protein
MPRLQGSFSQLMLFLMVLKNAAHFGAPITQSALSIRQCGFSPSHAHQKNKRQLFCSFLLNESLSDIFTKPLRFRFGSASSLIVKLFF